MLYFRAVSSIADSFLLWVLTVGPNILERVLQRGLHGGLARTATLILPMMLCRICVCVCVCVCVPVGPGALVRVNTCHLATPICTESWVLLWGVGRGTPCPCLWSSWSSKTQIPGRENRQAEKAKVHVRMELLLLPKPPRPPSQLPPRRTWL